MQKSSRKVKESPNAEELEAEFYNALRNKPSKTKSLKGNSYESNKENIDVSQKVHIKLSKKSGKKVKILCEEKEESGSQKIEESKKEIDIKEDEDIVVKKQVKKKDEKALEFVEILESKYVPSVFLYRDKEKNDILSFIFK